MREQEGGSGEGESGRECAGEKERWMEGGGGSEGGRRERGEGAGEEGARGRERRECEMKGGG